MKEEVPLFRVSSDPGAQDPPPAEDLPGRWEESEAEVELLRRKKRPRRHRVILHNDDFTTMEFVIRVLKEHFHKGEAEATHLMLQVHHKGRAVAGVYPQDMAESKVQEVVADARAHGMPLKCSSEPE